jgi:hypothetical protein
MASSLRRRYFGRYQNVLRIILIDSASLVTAPKEASLQRLVLGFPGVIVISWINIL